MTHAGPSPSAPTVSSPGVGAGEPPRRRWAAAVVLGTVLWAAAVGISHVVPQVFFGLRLEGPVYGAVAIAFAALAAAAVRLGLRPVRLSLRDVGLTSREWRRDVLIGAAIAIAFALLQFLVVIPNTGGAERSDIAMNRSQIGDSPWGVAGFLVLAWAGSFAEELFFRGHLVTTIRNALGNTRVGVGVTVAVVTLLFALVHGYQGWAGVLDTASYGGLTMTLLYLWRRRLTAPIVAHALWNSIAVVVIYLWY